MGRVREAGNCRVKRCVRVRGGFDEPPAPRAPAWALQYTHADGSRAPTCLSKPRKFAMRLSVSAPPTWPAQALSSGSP